MGLDEAIILDEPVIFDQKNKQTSQKNNVIMFNLTGIGYTPLFATHWQQKIY